MVCTKPITIRNPNSKGLDDRSLVVPCGKCLACRIAKKREWKIRLIHESYYHQKSAFVTFTYDDDNIPDAWSLEKRDMQLMLKRLRKELGERKIKYYLTGEYGDISERPHYHAIIFGVDHDDTELLEKVWPYGFVYVGNVEHDSIQYVCGYIEKKLYGEIAKEYYIDREVPFALMSKGLGKEYAKVQREQFLEKMSVTYRGKEQALPRYYSKVLGIDTEEKYEQAQKYDEKINDYWRKKGVDDVDYARHLARKQNELNIQARLDLNKKTKI